MSFLAAVLLLNMDQCNAFTCLANLLSKPCYNVFFRIDQKQVRQRLSSCLVWPVCQLGLPFAESV